MRFLSALIALLLALAPASACGQLLRGTVHDSGGAPVAGANVFVLETLEGTLSDSTGRFAFTVAVSPPFTVVIKRLGFADQRFEVAHLAALAIVLTRLTTPLAPITVRAGAWTAGAEQGATLTALEVVTTPGTAADINRTIQLLPGVQAVDDGTALFVRGGDYTETKVFLNEAPLLNPQQLMTPTGTFTGTVDPFQLDGIFFSSGGFGARYGNALSGVVGLRTRGGTTGNTGTLGAGLAATSADGAWRATPQLTLRVAGNRTDLDPFLRLNRNPRGFAPAPAGHDASASAIWNWRETGELKAFWLDQRNVVGLPIDDPVASGAFDSRVDSRLFVVTMREVLGSAGVELSASDGVLDRHQSFGAFQLNAEQRQRQLFVQASRSFLDGLLLRSGAEVEQVGSAIRGSLGATGQGPGRTTLYAFDRPATRTGVFVEAEWQATSSVRIVPGVRTDRSSLTGLRTVDPRLSASWRVRSGLVATAAWGVYHQVADPLAYDDAFGRDHLAPMRATQSVVGLQIGQNGPEMLRVELWEKRYRDLVLFDRDFRVVAPGSGTARGLDLFWRSRLPWNITTRTTLSLLRARRTDPESGQMAAALFDIPRSAAFIAEKAFANGLRLGANYRSSTGRPFTPVVDAVADPGQDRFLPVFGAANSERFPPIRRLDLSVSRYRPLTPQLQLVLYASVSNVLNATNTQGWRYSRDYRDRAPLPSIFNRSLYFGASVIWQ